MTLHFNAVYIYIEPLRVDESKISISGFSSGGFFAVQFHVAYSESLIGAGIIAGGERLSVCIEYM